MKDTDADGRKTHTELIDDLKDSLDKTMEGLRVALVRSNEKTEDQHDCYDGYGRLRDREIAHAARLGTVSAQLVSAIVRLQTGKT